MNEFVASLMVLFVVAYVQNMAFTWVSRSRNSGDPSYHRYAAICSNGIWFITNIMITFQVWDVLRSGNWWQLFFVGVVYIVATTEGSVHMMKILLKTEKGKRKVGAT